MIFISPLKFNIRTQTNLNLGVHRAIRSFTLEGDLEFQICSKNMQTPLMLEALMPRQNISKTLLFVRESNKQRRRTFLSSLLGK